MIYGYARISTNKQNIERQNRNILEQYPTAKLINETYTGTTTDRKEWTKLLKQIKRGDMIVFDSVSRMSRNATDGVKDYMDLFDKCVELVFIKEPHINTTIYKQQLDNAKLGMTDNNIVNAVLEGVEKALKLLATQQIEIAFQQSEKEVMDLKKRTVEGIITAKANGKVVGRPIGSKTSLSNNVPLNDFDNLTILALFSIAFFVSILELLDIDRTTYYRYKKQIKAEMETM